MSTMECWGPSSSGELETFQHQVRMISEHLAGGKSQVADLMARPRGVLWTRKRIGNRDATGIDLDRRCRYSLLFPLRQVAVFTLASLLHKFLQSVLHEFVQLV